MEDGALVHLVRTHFHWDDWERLIESSGITIDRPYRSAHPAFPDILYPMDYGYVNGTASSDGCEVDVFVGASGRGLVGLVMTRDHRRRDREMKLLYRCSPEEIYLAHGFLSFDRRRIEGTLVLRHTMRSLWH